MKTLKEQTDAAIAKTRQAKPEFMAKVDKLIVQAKELQQGNNAIGVGMPAPKFELPDQNGAIQSLSKFMEKGPVVITFYRGSWCPYCNLQLRALQARLSDINNLGAELVAISPQIPDNSMTDTEIKNIDFHVLSDQSATIAEKYGVAWEVPEILLDHMRVDRKLDLEAINNGNKNVLVIPATFVINTKGDVVWHHVDVDYRTRAEPSDIIDALHKLT